MTESRNLIAVRIANNAAGAETAKTQQIIQDGDEHDS
jgi:hypothetical protein